MAFTAQDKVGDIVVQLPKAGDIFKQHQIDFCCGGNKPLAEAASEKQIEVQTVLSELNQALESAEALNDGQVDWTKASYSDLIDWVLAHHHAYLHKTLPTLGELVTTILRVHGPNHEELATVHRLYHSLKAEFEEHLIKEETLIFPKVKQYEQSGSAEDLARVVSTIDQLESEHEASGNLIKQLREVTNGYSVPDDGCGTYHYTYEKLSEVEADTFTHIHLENNILFPRLRAQAGVQSA